MFFSSLSDVKALYLPWPYKNYCLKLSRNFTCQNGPQTKQTASDAKWLTVQITNLKNVRYWAIFLICRPFIFVYLLSVLFSRSHPSLSFWKFYFFQVAINKLPHSDEQLRKTKNFERNDTVFIKIIKSQLNVYRATFREHPNYIHNFI